MKRESNMSTEHKINATARVVEGKGASRRLRHAGIVPAIVYGGHAAPVSIQLDHEKLWLTAQTEWFYSSIITLDIDGKTEKVLLRDLQRHPWKARVLHLDFQRVSEHEAIRVSVPLHFINEDISPAGKVANVVISRNVNEVTVQCLPKDLPESLQVDLAALNVGDMIHLSQLKLPAGVEIPELKLGKEHDVLVASAAYVQEEAEPAPAEGEAAAAPAAGKEGSGEK